MQKEEITLIKSYTGVVTDVSKDTFSATITEKSTKETSDIIISKDQVFYGSHIFIIPGANFTWDVGYSGNNQKRVPLSLIRFSPAAQK
jgi:hypothetical protein